jgi:hypothetical protein
LSFAFRLSPPPSDVVGPGEAFRRQQFLPLYLHTLFSPLL